MLHYCVAGLTVAMDTFGRTLTQAAPYLMDTPAMVDIMIDADWMRIKNRHPYLSDEDCEYAATGASFYRHLLSFHGFMLHSSAIVVDGRAYLFTANSGTGKSTHTRLWLELFGDRAFILNDDKPALRQEDGVWYAYGTPWSGKHDISANVRVPVAGIACLERGEANFIEPFSGQEAILAILRQSNRPKSPECRIKLLELLDKLITQVPIWKLQCNMDPEAAIVSYEAMSGENGGNSMKLKEGFIVREVAGQIVVLPTGDELDLNMMITLNDTGRFLWERLEQDSTEEALVAALLAEYDVDEDTAKSAVAGFIARLNEHGFLI